MLSHELLDWLETGQATHLLLLSLKSIKNTLNNVALDAPEKNKQQQKKTLTPG